MVRVKRTLLEEANKRIAKQRAQKKTRAKQTPQMPVRAAQMRPAQKRRRKQPMQVQARRGQVNGDASARRRRRRKEQKRPFQQISSPRKHTADY